MIEVFAGLFRPTHPAWNKSSHAQLRSSFSFGGAAIVGFMEEGFQRQTPVGRYALKLRQSHSGLLVSPSMWMLEAQQ